MTVLSLVSSASQTILLSPEFSCAEEVLCIVSLLSVDSVLYNPPARREEVLAVRKKFTSSEGDHMTLLNIYRAFKKVSGNKVRKGQVARESAYTVVLSSCRLNAARTCFAGVVPGELCQQQEHEPGERSAGATQRYLP